MRYEQLGGAPGKFFEEHRTRLHAHPAFTGGSAPASVMPDDGEFMRPNCCMAAPRELPTPSACKSDGAHLRIKLYASMKWRSALHCFRGRAVLGRLLCPAPLGQTEGKTRTVYALGGEVDNADRFGERNRLARGGRVGRLKVWSPA